MEVAITGAGGLLGRYLLKTRPVWAKTIALWHTRHFEHIANADFLLDITDASAVQATLEGLRPSVLIHCAGLGDVDEVERDAEKGWSINVEATGNIVEQCGRLGIKLVYISTNAVFGGANAPYTEACPMLPINTYGYQKGVAETYVRELPSALIIRPILLYGWPWEGGRSNWATRLYHSLRDGKAVNVVDDRVTQPTYARDVAEAIWTLLHKDRCGTYNVGGADICTLFTFARKVAQVFQLDANLVQPAKSDDFPTLAPRPINTTYDLEKLYREDIHPGGIVWGLSQMRGEQ